MPTTLKLNFILKNWQFVTREFYFGIMTKRYHLIFYVAVHLEISLFVSLRPYTIFDIKCAEE